MIYRQQKPREELRDYIKSFWLIDSDGDRTSSIQKIIPDGYPEIIFHYKSAFKINFSEKWLLQNKYLVAGQIRNHFYLENTGEMGMFGIKLQPWTLKLLFELNLNSITDRVISIEEANLEILNPIRDFAIGKNIFESKVKSIENWFLGKIVTGDNNIITEGQKAVQLLIERKGELSIQTILDRINISERSLERYFESHIGLSPKYYSRIIRFANIFSLVKKDNFNWSDIAYLAGYYDQSHFIKNFKEFTGEEPSQYGFDETNMANFFLKK